MPRYIDADALLEALNKKKCEPGKQRYIEGFNDAIMRVRSMISSAATADAVEVVRCKDCKHRRTTPYGSFCLPAYGLKRITDLDSFCSYGERKDK